MSAIAVSIAGFVCVSSAVSTLWRLLARWYDPVRRRLMASVAPPAQRGHGGFSAPAAILQRRFDAVVALVLRMLLLDVAERAPGFRTWTQKAALLVFVGVSAWIGAVAASSAFARMALSMPALWLGTVLAAWVAMAAAARGWTRWQARRWANSLNMSLIDMLDLWVLCLGAGMSFQAALVRVLQDPLLTSPALREQLQLTHQEMLAGVPRDEALRHLARRSGNSADLKALVSNIIQAERLGSSLTQTLRVYAGSLRFKRHQDAKELIHQLSVKLAFPLVFCILPALFVVIMGPALLRMFGAFTGQ